MSPKKKNTHPTISKKLHKIKKEIDKLKLPVSVFTGINLTGNDVHIAEVGAEKMITHIHNRKGFDSREALLDWLDEHSKSKNFKFISAGITNGKDLEKLGSKLWLEKDTVPIIVHSKNEQSLKAKDLARTAADNFVDGVAKVGLGKANEVDVSFLVTLNDYKKVTKENDFKLLLKLAKKFKGKKIVFFSATPRGGGVALMRHALIRLFRLLGVDASWHVLLERKEVFDITKTKFHNVLHGIARPEIVLTEKDKKLYNSWIAENFENLKGVFESADVIIIDDPQPSGLMPLIRANFNGKVIIYRSHIQLQSYLIKDKSTPQHITWKFIWDNIKSCDAFISHPIKKFIPENVPKEKVFFMTASTDPLDGLNKPLNKDQLDYYTKLINKLLLEEGQKPLDLDRPIITQVARFDPSKGIGDVLEMFGVLRGMYKSKKHQKPQLLIGGNSSVDDPDGVPVYNLTNQIVEDKYSGLAEDIKILRFPHIDQISNTIMRRANIYLQLSHREGFEDKITGAVMKGTPTIIYNEGGMPLQIIDGVSGYIAEVCDTKKVAKLCFNLLTDKNLHKKISTGAVENILPEATTVSNAINWLYLANRFLKNRNFKGKMGKVYDMVRS